ncbi:hypothetical protein SYNPS1DRAFT_27652 [Syncephalis pseudoplumigaleata]|uniref:Uncharacterized protein n=1 Tax=Syncephalis pseudoplumigaleata TaxID=1712513 RepID=A0A4P9Z4B0_9FUNG|nr:hypothetical protein SYNPS1DRAFT_27652 [Syncephalis pseudoplumigaleata]|eukprot:RKP26671.1 hypothetical protein SYNPS1DRAFT_27652 [Syncephalis pseudoplumigaleata]
MSVWSTSWAGPRPSDIVPPPGMTLVSNSSPTPTSAVSADAAPTSTTTTTTPPSSSSSSSTATSTSTTSSSSPSASSASASSTPTSNATPSATDGTSLVDPTASMPPNPTQSIRAGTGSTGSQPDVHTNSAVTGDAADGAVSGSASVGVIVGGAIGGLLLLFIVVGLFVYRRRRRQHMVFTGKEFGAGAARGIFPESTGHPGAREKGLAGGDTSHSMFTRELPQNNAPTYGGTMSNVSSSIAAGAVAAAATSATTSPTVSSPTPGFLYHKTSLSRAPSPGNAATASAATGARPLPPLPTLEIREHRTTSPPPPPLQISAPVWSPNGSPKPATESSMTNSTTTLDSEPATPHRLRLSNVNARRVSDSYSDLPTPMTGGGHMALRIDTEIEEERVGVDSDDEGDGASTSSHERGNLPVPESPLTRRLSARKNKRLSYNMGDSFDPSIASAVAAASRIESGEDAATNPTLSDMAAAVLNASRNGELADEPLEPPRRSFGADSVASSAPTSFFAPRSPLTAVYEEGADAEDGSATGTHAATRNQNEPADRATTLSKLMSENFNPELMFGIPANSNAPRAGRSNSNNTHGDDDDESVNGGRSRSNRRGSTTTIATRFDEPRTPSFVRRDSAFFPQDF